MNSSLRLDPGLRRAESFAALDEIPEFDCVVIVTDHSEHDFSWIVDKAKVVVDMRNATKGIEAASIVRC